MHQFLTHLTATDLLAIGVGVALLTAGRKLYWLALGAAGFFIGLGLAGHLPELGSTGLELGLGFLIGVLGAYLAVAAQRLAVGLGGFLIGGALAWWTASWLAVALGWQPGPWLGAAAILGAILGTLAAAVLFEASLLALTSLCGALLIARASHAGTPHEGWLFLILLCLGVIVQSGVRRRRVERTG